MTGFITCDRAIVERSGRIVIDRLTLAVEAGETLAVIGPTGAGKSSLLAALATVVPLHGGDITVAGRSVRRDPDQVRPEIGYVPPLLNGCPAIRADEFLGLFAAAAGLVGRGARDAIEQALAVAGLTTSAGERLDALPEGQVKLLLVARALMHRPAVLILDDPFSCLDHPGRIAVERLIEDLHIAGRTVVAAIDDARVPDCFSSLAVLRDGRLMRHGPATPAAMASGRSFRHRIHCEGPVEAAAQAARRLAERVAVVDAHTLDCVLDDQGPSIGAIVGAIVRAGLMVTAVGFQPSWTEQLLDDAV